MKLIFISLIEYGPSNDLRMELRSFCILRNFQFFAQFPPLRFMGHTTFQHQKISTITRKCSKFSSGLSTCVLLNIKNIIFSKMGPLLIHLILFKSGWPRNLVKNSLLRVHGQHGHQTSTHVTTFMRIFEGQSVQTNAENLRRFEGQHRARDQKY